MSDANRRPASLVGRKSPEDQPMALTPVESKQGRVEVEINNGAVTIFGKYGRLVWCEMK